ncbi:ABC transporter substrate-binding protein [Scrofimicrobium sp. R131]|uniref:ABC transporter substrate-binding protein n=1 Tax=Scrofimicrobium appendicitidis TaxID=3079930 RepID=A0AAU7V6D1_9ACTO
MKKSYAWAAAATLGVTVLAGCGSPESLDGTGQSGQSNQSEGGSESLIVGSSNFSENVVLANIFAEVLRDEGFDVTVKPNIGSREVLMPALEDGSVDLVPEYSGSLLAYLDSTADVTEADQIIEQLHQVLPEGLTLLEPAEAQNKDSIIVTPEFAEEHGVKAIPDLAPLASELTFGGPPESKERRAGLGGLESVYGLKFKEFKPIDLGGPLTIAALQKGDIQVGQMYSTQPAIADFVVLEDPEHTSTAEQVVPLVRTDANNERVQAALDRVMQQLTTDDLIALNTKVETDKQDPQKVAREFVDSLQ